MLQRGEKEAAKTTTRWIRKAEPPLGEKVLEEGLGEILGVGCIVSDSSDERVKGRPIGPAKFLKGVVCRGSAVTACFDDQAPVGGGERG